MVCCDARACERLPAPPKPLPAPQRVPVAAHAPEGAFDRIPSLMERWAGCKVCWQCALLAFEVVCARKGAWQHTGMLESFSRMSARERCGTGKILAQKTVTLCCCIKVC